MDLIDLRNLDQLGAREQGLFFQETQRERLKHLQVCPGADGARILFRITPLMRPLAMMPQLHVRVAKGQLCRVKFGRIGEDKLDTGRS